LHDIKKLGNRAKNYSSELLQVFPIATPEQKEKAYGFWFVDS